MLLRVQGNVSVYDMTSKVNIHTLRPDFIRYGRTSPSITCKFNDNGKIIFEDSSYKPFSSPMAENMMLRTIHHYLDNVNQTTKVQLIRVIENQFVSMTSCKGIMCMGRENIKGGLLSVPLLDFYREIIAGEMIIINQECDMSLSDISIIDPMNEGYLNLLIFK